MLNIYVSYKCKKCGKEFVLLVEEVQSSDKKNIYLVCPYCSSKKVAKQNITDNLRACMRERSYRRKRGSIIEVK
ncbi:hypothetical protein [Clostridium tyrobutyricum]|uniref:Zn-finger containing protein n=1 Tax=Clostridium tyrobutyricum TaxID=1519 RepID=A0A0A7HFV1_CLOTY|nr:hypothetical protein [Clostridium tyrobutyricum]AIZ03783.1 Zn-finger containing protein [Clostridium tyrobutyricum]MBV4417188.1 hypothetical protein [Clostridium tyrobutyricum]